MSSTEALSLDDIVEGLSRRLDRRFPRQALLAAQARPAEMTPRLIDEIQKATQAVRDGDSYVS